jgi:hypothetical protein
MVPETLRRCIDWYASADGVPVPDAAQYCATRDVFEGRLSRFLANASRVGVADTDSSLLTAIVGEIGNNSFDHNLGHWRDQPGCYFGSALDGAPMLVWVADRGRGVLQSLRAVVPDLADHRQALEMAFERLVSGRSPERRGNGLKFVRSVINGHANRGLVSASGRATLDLGGEGRALRSLIPWPVDQDYGMLTVVSWRRP